MLAANEAVKKAAEWANVMKVKKIELEVATSIQINHLKIDFSYANKDVKTSQISLQKL